MGLWFDTFFFLPLQDNHEEDYFLYVAYSDESVYGKWAAVPQACRRDGLMELIGGQGEGVEEEEEECLRRGEENWKLTTCTMPSSSVC